MIYTLGLRMGGLMEDPEFHVEYITSVEAANLEEAKQFWAEKTGHIDQDWDPIRKSYWGWAVVDVTKNMHLLDRYT